MLIAIKVCLGRLKLGMTHKWVIQKFDTHSMYYGPSHAIHSFLGREFDYLKWKKHCCENQYLLNGNVAYDVQRMNYLNLKIENVKYCISWIFLLDFEIKIFNLPYSIIFDFVFFYFGNISNFHKEFIGPLISKC